MRTLISFLAGLAFTSIAFAQNDTTIVLGYADFIARVSTEHPLAKRADIKIEEGESKLLYGRSGFDPQLYTGVGQKYFKDTQYYSLIDGGLKVPTWFGIELKAGYQQNGGTYLNPENNTPGSGLVYAGVSIPVGQGLFIDKRRADLKKAQLNLKVTELEQQLILNELLYQAGQAYWKWFEAYNTLLVYNEAYQLANQRFDAVKQEVLIGERPFIDTLEAGIQVQNRLLGLQQSQLKVTNAAALVSTYLWENGIIPLELADATIPESLEKVTMTSLNPAIATQLDTLIAMHPLLEQSRFKIGQLEIEKRLQKERLKPVLNLKYNPIAEYANGNTFQNFSINNYTWGLEFKMPLMLRKERSSVKLTDLKIQESQYLLNNKQQAIRYKVMAAHNRWNTSLDQLKLYTQTAQDYKGLLQAEQRLFSIGESSLFMVNAREVGYIKTQIKLISLLKDNRQALLSIYYELGYLPKSSFN